MTMSLTLPSLRRDGRGFTLVEILIVIAVILWFFLEHTPTGRAIFAMGGNREAARLENGQARTERMEARAGADGHVGRYEQRGIQRAENRQSRQIHNERHDGQTRGFGEHRQGYGGESHHQSYGARHDGGFRSAPQHSYQPRHFAQAGGHRFR